jgi:AcrR family transcriptional regulator
MTVAARKRPTRAQKREQNRDRLLEAAMRVFADAGYHGATIERITEESGLSNGALYYNFANKEELFFALLDHRMEARMREAVRVFGGGRGEVTESEVARAAGRGPYGPAQRREWALFFEFVAHSGRDARFRSQFRRRLRRMRATISGLVSGAPAEGPPLALPPDQVAIAFQALGWGLWAQRLVDPTAIPDDLLPRLIVALLRGLAEPG